MGLVLVFDMDQTILDSSDPSLYDDVHTSEEISNLESKIVKNLNLNVLRILVRASKLRTSGKVTAIFLLTNNSSIPLVTALDNVLLEISGSRGHFKRTEDPDVDEFPEKPYFFDYIMVRQNPRRPKLYNPPKRLYDILAMMEHIGIYDEHANPLKDIYFFDDIGNHQLHNDFKILEHGKYLDHYIHITPPFSTKTKDVTDYTPILQALSERNSNNRSPRTYRNLRGGRRFTKKIKKMTKKRIRKNVIPFTGKM
jgi:hypothetical protein